MKCYRHDDRDARAVCRHCGRALCGECATEGSGGMSCGETCAGFLDIAHRMLIRANANFDLQRKTPLYTGYFLVLTGGAFFLVDFLMGDNQISPLTLLMGTLFIICGIAAIRVASKHTDA